MTVELSSTAGSCNVIVDNQTQQLPDGTFLFASPLFSGTELTGERVAFVNSAGLYSQVALVISG